MKTSGELGASALESTWPCSFIVVFHRRGQPLFRVFRLECFQELDQGIDS